MLDSDKNKSLSFGRYLQAVRLENKQSLEEVAEKTRVGLNNLVLIEQEDHDRLPAEVFVKGFIRAYADAVRADADEAVRRYESRLDVFQKIADSERTSAGGTSKLVWKLLIAAGLFGCIIVASIYGISYFQARITDKSPPAQPAPIAPESNPAAPPQGQLDIAPKSADIEPQKLKLKVAAREETWLKVIIDEGDPKEFKLTPGENIEFEAASKYNILIGNAGGVDLTLDGKPVSVPGKSGQVVTLQIP
jgi:hypothetical protein